MTEPTVTDRLNPVTRKRLWYIAAFLLFDGIVSLGVAATVPPTDVWALPSIAFGLVTVVAGGAMVSFLVSTKINVNNLGSQRSRE